MLEGALLFSVFFGPLAFGCVEVWSLGIMQAVLFSLPFLARSESTPGLSAPRPLLWSIGIVLLLGAAQILNPTAMEGPMSMLPFTASPWHTKRALLLWASYGMIVWYGPRAFVGSRPTQRFVWAMVLVGFLVAVIGLVQAAQGNKFVMGFRPVGYGHSPFGPYYNNAHAASLLAVSSFMGLGLLCSQLVRTFFRVNSVEPRADAVARQLLLSFLIAVTLIGLFATRNRGSILAFGGASFLLTFLACGMLKRAPIRWGARVAVLIVFIGITLGAVQLGLWRRGNQSSFPIRLSMYRSGLTLLSDAPLWGTGLGTVKAVFRPYKDPSVIGVVDHVHNDWLELPIQAGIPAATAIAVALIVFGWRVHRGWSREPSLEKRCLVAGGFGAAVCFLLHALVEFTWQIPANAVVFLLILSWIWSQEPEVSAYRTPASRSHS